MLMTKGSQKSGREARDVKAEPQRVRDDAGQPEHRAIQHEEKQPQRYEKKGKRQDQRDQ